MILKIEKQNSLYHPHKYIAIFDYTQVKKANVVPSLFIQLLSEY